MTNRPPRANEASAPVLVLRHDGRAVSVAIKRSAQARRYSLRLRAAERDAVLTVPKRGSIVEATAFAERHVAWLLARLARLPKQVPFADGAIIPIRGVPHRIQHRPKVRGTAWIEKAEDGPPRLVVAGERPHVARRVRDFLAKEAHVDLARLSAKHAAGVGRKISRITIRDARTRWGSCTAAGRLSFSWRIVMAPPHVADYLAAHEVAHLVHLNHSKAFWTLVGRLCPNAAAARTWLRSHGSDLHHYGSGVEPEAAAAAPAAQSGRARRT